MARGVAESVLDLIGQTPLLHLSRFAQPPLAGIYAKIEWLNPGGSVKDRAALGMILDAEEKGLLKPGATIIEPTAGNTGIGLALVGVARGYRVILCVPRGFAVEKMKLIEALGGELEYVSHEAGMQGAIDRCHELAETIDDSFVPQQFENNANPCFHELTTAREIIEQMNGGIDAVVIGAGTSGTFCGVARRCESTIRTCCVCWWNRKDRFTAADRLDQRKLKASASAILFRRSSIASSGRRDPDGPGRRGLCGAEEDCQTGRTARRLVVGRCRRRVV